MFDVLETGSWCGWSGVRGVFVFILPETRIWVQGVSGGDLRKH